MVERLTAAADTASVAAAAPAVAQWSTDRIRSAPRPLLGPPHYASKGLTFIIQYDWTAWKEMKFSHMILYKTGKAPHSRMCCTLAGAAGSAADQSGPYTLLPAAAA